MTAGVSPTDSTGHYAIPNLPAPGTYDLSFSASGYEVASDTEELAGGEQRIAATIDLTAGTGTLGGSVTDGTNRVSSVAGIRRTREVNGCSVPRSGWVTIRLTVTAYHGMMSLGRQ